MVKYKNEKSFVTAYLKDMKDSWQWVYKLPDIGYVLKPFDAISVELWVPFAMEFKYWDVNTYKKAYNMLRPNQIWWLKRFQEAGWKSFIIWWDVKDEKIYTYPFEYQWKNKKEL